MRTVELFCGIGGFRLACDELSIKTVWANDIGKKSNHIYKQRFGSQELHEGDIKELVGSVPDHDLLTAGFPCQPFSSAGKKKGIEDPRGTLFQSIVEILKLKKPKFFVLENVKRLVSMQSGKHFATILSAISEIGYAIEWRIINAKDLGLPQNRQRIFIVGIREDEFIEKQFPCLINRGNLASKETSYLDAALNSDFYSVGKRIADHNIKFKEAGLARKGFFIDYNVLYKDKTNEKKMSSILDEDVEDIFDFTEDTKERVKNSKYINKYYNGVQLLWNQGGGARMGYTVFGTEGLSPTLTASTSRHYERYFIKNKFRRLTHREYAKLQGFPLNHCAEANIYDQYSLYGNAVPPIMAKWAINSLINSYKKSFHKEEKKSQLILF